MKQHKIQFISIFLMSFLTVMIFAGVGAESYGVQQVVDKYYEDTNMADIWVYSQQMDNKTYDDLKSISGIEDTERQLVVTTTAQLSGDPTIKMHFIENNKISKYYPLDGSDINMDDADGLWLDKSFADAHKLKVGDKITVKMNGIEITKTIRGLGYSPEYVYQETEGSIIPDFSLQGFAYASYKAFPTDNISYDVVLIKTNDTSDVFQEKIDDKIDGKYSTLIPQKDHSSVVQFQSEIDQHNMMGKMFPLIFVVVALLTLITTMTRIVNHQRTQIGTLKALGFSNRKLSIHYMSYGFYLTLIGSILGLVIGQNTIPYLFYPSMSAFYKVPTWKPGFDISFIYVALILIVLSTLFAYLTTKNIVRQSPASALEPKAPKISKGGFIERTRLWKHLGFIFRWNIRDIRRNKIRSLVTVVSIIGCTILLISAFGMSEGMDDLKTWQYGTINQYNNQLLVDDNATDVQIQSVLDDVKGTQIMTTPIEIKANNMKKTVNVNVYNKTDLIQTTDNAMNLMEIPEDGVSLTYKTAELMNIKKGDTIKWHIYGEDKWVETKVDEIYADPTNQGLTIRPDKFEKLGYNFTPTSIVTNHDVNSSYPGISTINGVDDLQNTWDELMESGNLLVAILLIFAVLLSVVMLYSLSILSFTEIERELATLKVIGFKSKIIQKIFLIQNLALSIIGYIIGIPVGYYVLRVMMDTSGETFYYPIHYSLQTMALTFIAVVILSFIVNLLLVRKIKDIDLVASLKLIRE